MSPHLEALVRWTAGMGAVLETVLSSRIVFRPVDEAEPKYELTIPIQFDRVLIAAVPSLARAGMASPTGMTPFHPSPFTAVGTVAPRGVAPGAGWRTLRYSYSPGQDL